MIEPFETERCGCARSRRTTSTSWSSSTPTRRSCASSTAAGRAARRGGSRSSSASLGHRWIAYDRATGDFVGWFGHAPVGPTSATRELGYRLRRDAWGKGLATEGSRALIDVAFTRLGAERVWAQTMTVNTASRRVMERCGLRFVRTFFGDWDEPIEGAELGDVEYELTKAEWERGRA